MANQILYELHPASLVSREPSENGGLSWQPERESRRGPPIRITGKEEFFWARMNSELGTLEPVQEPDDATLGFRTVSRRISMDLVMVTTEDHVLVNGVPALRLAVLGPRDSVMLGTNRMFYVTQRVKPHVGPPTEEMLGEKCPFCRIPFDAKTTVVTCSCKTAYHNEPPTKKGALECFRKMNNCLECRKELSLDEYLVWDPEEL